MGNKFKKHRRMKDQDAETVGKFLRAKRLQEKARLQKMRAKIDLDYDNFAAYLPQHHELDDEHRAAENFKAAPND